MTYVLQMRRVNPGGPRALQIGGLVVRALPVEADQAERVPTPNLQRSAAQSTPAHALYSLPAGVVLGDEQRSRAIGQRARRERALRHLLQSIGVTVGQSHHHAERGLRGDAIRVTRDELQ